MKASTCIVVEILRQINPDWLRNSSFVQSVTSKMSTVLGRLPWYAAIIVPAIQFTIVVAIKLSRMCYTLNLYKISSVTNEFVFEKFGPTKLVFRIYTSFVYMICFDSEFLTSKTDADRKLFVLSKIDDRAR